MIKKKEEEKGVHAINLEDDENVEEMSQNQNHRRSFQDVGVQLNTYSHYKGTYTCKFLTGVTPAGNISFISKPYGGRASDKAIFEQSNLKNLLQPGNAVMVDRGFLIDDTCKMNGWKCIRPPFFKNEKQFTKSEAILTSKIVRARIYIEKSNQRIKAFQIVGSRLPVNLVPLLEEIFTVLCATVNLNSTILKDVTFIHT
ncbi:hypothetical protein RF55_17260 [Lasius niger]|uniref:DDE Tnp4 domain-containing protein n=1 Tax=Lasius niger TaxID=67767 RepID=A0A0J7K3H1_LASNI|nr:hypothetical protein RF55_17260 [Lasius niger]